MVFRSILQRLHRTGPVEIGLCRSRSGNESYVAACTADDCGWSADFETYSAACVAARGHRCRVRR